MVYFPKTSVLVMDVVAYIQPLRPELFSIRKGHQHKPQVTNMVLPLPPPLMTPIQDFFLCSNVHLKKQTKPTFKPVLVILASNSEHHKRTHLLNVAATGDITALEK